MRWTIVRSVGATSLLAIMLAGCQTASQSRMSAEDSCLSSGYRPGTRTYNRCVQTAYSDYRADSRASADAVAAGAAAGLVGGAVIAAGAGPYYGYGPYYGSGPYYEPGVYVGRGYGTYSRRTYGPAYQPYYGGQGPYPRW
jgi:hypothetical protein